MPIPSPYSEAQHWPKPRRVCCRWLQRTPEPGRTRLEVSHATIKGSRDHNRLNFQILSGFVVLGETLLHAGAQDLGFGLAGVCAEDCDEAHVYMQKHDKGI